MQRDDRLRNRAELGIRTEHYIHTDTNPITLPCSLARAGNKATDKATDKATMQHVGGL